MQMGQKTKKTPPHAYIMLDLGQANGTFKTRVVGAAAYLLLALMDHFEIDVGPPSSDLERPFEP